MGNAFFHTVIDRPYSGRSVPICFAFPSDRKFRISSALSRNCARMMLVNKGGGMAGKWNEAGRIWQEDETLLTAEEIAQCARAQDSEPRSPVPTRMVSNGEYMPAPQTDKQRQVEAR